MAHLYKPIKYPADFFASIPLSIIKKNNEFDFDLIAMHVEGHVKTEYTHS